MTGYHAVLSRNLACQAKRGRLFTIPDIITTARQRTSPRFTGVRCTVSDTDGIHLSLSPKRKSGIETALIAYFSPSVRPARLLYLLGYPFIRNRVENYFPLDHLFVFFAQSYRLIIIPTYG